jgi:hypothetical protein
MLLDNPGLDVGAHLAIVGEDPPLLTAREIPTLVDQRGALPLSYRTVILRGLVGRLDPDDVRREFAAQLERIRSAGITVSHLDTHQHTHLWPAVAGVLVELARQHDIPAVRTPRLRRSRDNGRLAAGAGPIHDGAAARPALPASASPDDRPAQSMTVRGMSNVPPMRRSCRRAWGAVNRHSDKRTDDKRTDDGTIACGTRASDLNLERY